MLEDGRYMADPLADETIARILGPWVAESVLVGKPENDEPHIDDYPGHWLKIAAINSQFEHWQTNAHLAKWPAQDIGIPSELRFPLQDYLQVASILPEWADPEKIERAEQLFIEYGALSCSLLFCSSLSECYVIPDLSALLHAAGQLEQHTDHRIRSTAAMIFPLMLKGGLCHADGSGVAQILKVRLIHATIRNLILRGSPADAMHHFNKTEEPENNHLLTPLAMQGASSLHHTLFGHGWKLGQTGLPCNQEELAYTLLTFGYVFLRSMRKLGIALPQRDEEDFLHLWNVVGAILGIRREFMVDTMAEATILFAQMQARGRAHRVSPDPRPQLGSALMHCMQQVIPLRVLKPFPQLMTRYLCGSSNARDIGIHQRVAILSQSLFIIMMLTARTIDAVVRLALPQFSFSRLIVRVLGYHFMSKIMMDQTRPLKLPEHLLNEVNSTMADWSVDPKSPRWLNAIESRFTTKEAWNSPER